jgi:hypothetical protein
MSDPTCRPAVTGDAADIHALMLKLAGEIPLAVETLVQEEALYAALRKTLGCGESWVVEVNGRIVGCVLVENVQTGRHWGEYETLDLRYAVGEGLDALIGKVLERHALILASVKDTNRAALAARLERLGFHEGGSQLGERRYRREP